MATVGSAPGAANINPSNSIQSYENAMEQSNGDDWPKDVVIDILSRLPVKSLMRFKCLQKSLCVVIQSPEFVSQHLNNYYNNSRNSSFIAQCRLNSSDHCGDFYGDVLMFSPNQTSQHGRLDLPFPASLLGPCNGIYLLYKYCARQFSLWNPATKQLITLPPSPDPELPSHIEYDFPTHIEYDFPMCGFGLNPATNDFKIVVIRPFCRIPYPSGVMVYTSSSNSWRDLGNPLQDGEWSYEHPYGYTYAQGQGIYYWLRAYEPVLVSFDMGSDSFELFQTPVSDSDSGNISIYHDSLALFSYECHMDEGCVDVWVLNNRNWIKQLSVSSPVGLYSLFGFWINDWLLFMTDDTQLVILNPITGELKSLHPLVHNTFLSDCVGHFTYRESLFSIKIGDDDN